LFPSMPFLTLEGRAHNLLRTHLLGSADLGLGSVDGTRTVDFGGGQLVSYPAKISQLEVGTSVLWEERFFDDSLEVAGGARTAAYFFHHELTGAPKPEQSYLVWSPGVVGLVGWNFAQWGHVELMGRAHYLPYNVDEVKSLALLDGVASVWFDF
jgi:hypothetical protein